MASAKRATILAASALIILMSVVLVAAGACHVNRGLRADYRWRAAFDPFSIFLVDNATSGDVASLEASLAANPYVRSVTYVSKEQALIRFREEVGPDVATGATSSEMPASIDVRFTERSERAVRSIIRAVEANPAFKRAVEQRQGEPWWWRWV